MQLNFQSIGGGKQNYPTALCIILTGHLNLNIEECSEGQASSLSQGHLQSMTIPLTQRSTEAEKRTMRFVSGWLSHTASFCLKTQ